MNPDKKNIKEKNSLAFLKIMVRINYKIPYIFFQNQNIGLFYFDLNSKHLFFEIRELFIPKRFLPNQFINLLARKTPSKINEIIKDRDLRNLISIRNKKTCNIY